MPSGEKAIAWSDSGLSIEKSRIVLPLRLTVAAVTRALERGATAPPGRGTGAAAARWGHGELNATAALDAAQGLTAAQPSPVPSISPIVVPAVTSTAPIATSGSADPGHLLRSLVTGLAVAAAALIACLIGVIALTRRRRRRARSATLVTTARPGHRAGRARHARRRPGAAARVLPATAAWPGGTARRPRPAEEPPWPPALPPGRELPVALPPARVLPVVRALPAVQPEARPADAPLAPWERSPAEFAAAPPQPELTPWPVSSTGPMYVWNPAATTGPLPAVEDDELTER